MEAVTRRKPEPQRSSHLFPVSSGGSYGGGVEDSLSALQLLVYQKAPGEVQTH